MHFYNLKEGHITQIASFHFFIFFFSGMFFFSACLLFLLLGWMGIWLDAIQRGVISVNV